MRPVSQEFLTALTGSHNIATRLRAVPAGQTGTAPTGGVLLPLIDGDVQLDGSADVRATTEVTIAAHDPATGERLWPEGASSPLTPYGTTELFVERGIEFGGGSVEYVSLGYFRINDVEQPEAPDGPIRIAGADRMSMIIDSPLTTPVQYGPSVTYETVVQELAEDAYADVVIEWDDPDVAGDPIGRTAIVEKDRYSFIRELVVGLGKVAYFDHRGVLRIRSLPSSGYPVWTVSRGARGVLVSASRSISREGVYNGVLATGEALDTEPPVQALAVDSTPGSPTLWGGPFGKISREFASPLLTTTAQCALAAATVLRKSVGLPYNVDLTAVPNPALEPDDMIAIGVEGVPVVVEPELFVGDSFSRTVVDGVGNAESGQTWSKPAGSDVNTQVNGGVFRRTITAGNGTGLELLGSLTGRHDVDVYCDVQVPVAAVGASLVAGVALRYASGSDFYGARIEFNTNGLVSSKLHKQLGGYEELVVVNDFAAYSAGQWWTMRARARGDVIEFKTWPRDTASEPGEWLWSTDDTTEPGLVSRFGLWTWRVGANSNTGPQWLFDNFRAYTVPPSPLRGGELHVLDSLTIPLTADAAMSGSTREQTLITIETS